jgi:hypothetical protein
VVDVVVVVVLDAVVVVVVVVVGTQESGSKAPISRRTEQIGSPASKPAAQLQSAAHSQSAPGPGIPIRHNTVQIGSPASRVPLPLQSPCRQIVGSRRRWPKISKPYMPCCS